ncbi:mycothiol-dependent reductase [Nocardioides lentus]|uniref:Mycothiol-dependent reductase n=1 Tax=Nocardioides lentus TaxID=338077 RepID=A0ABN2NXU2_9ACTN
MAKGKPGRGKQRSREQQVARREARQAERKREQEAKVERERARRRRRTLVQIGTGAGMLVLVGALVAWLVLRESASDITADGPPGTDDDGAVVLGEESAPVTVEIISDFGCPACAQFDAQAGPALDQYVEEGQVRLEYRVVTALDRASPNEFSSRAAAAAGCVLDQGDLGVWRDFTTAVYASQPAEQTDGPSDTELIGLATTAGADEAEVTECIDSGARAEWADAVDSEAAGDYTATPDVVVDGERLTEPTPLVLQNAITGALAEG